MQVGANYYINFYIAGVYDCVYSAVHPIQYLESDVMWYKLQLEQQNDTV